MLSIGTIIGHDIEVIGTGLELFFQDNDVLISETDDRSDFRTKLVEFLGDRHGNGTADTAADDADFLNSFGMGGNP